MNSSALPAEKNIFSPGLDAPPEVLGRYHLHEYAKFLAWPLLAFVIVNAVAMVVNRPIINSWLILAIFFAAIIWRVRQTDFSEPETKAALAISGLMAGTTQAIMRLISAPEFHMYFNLIAEPLMTGGLGWVVGWATLRLLGRRNLTRTGQPFSALTTVWRQLRKGV